MLREPSNGERNSPYQDAVSSTLGITPRIQPRIPFGQSEGTRHQIAGFSLPNFIIGITPPAPANNPFRAESRNKASDLGLLLVDLKGSRNLHPFEPARFRLLACLPAP